MYILGISDSHDAGAAVVKDGKIIAAVSEERLCREKGAYGFPFKSIPAVLKIAGITAKDIEYVIKGGNPYPYIYSSYNTTRNRHNRFLPEIKLDEMYNLSIFHKLFINYIKERKVYSSQELQSFSRMVKVNNRSSELTKNSLRKLGLNKDVYFLDHHYCHLASAFYTSGFDKALVFSLDFSGDNKSGMVGIGNRNKIDVVEALDAQNSVGCFYGFVTKGLGFKLNRHEGKIVGLAAYGNPEKLYSTFKKFIWHSKSRIIVRQRYKLLSLVGQFEKKDAKHVAAAAQRLLEEVTVAWIKYFIDKHKLSNIILTGGVFANVKLNQRIHEIKAVKNVWVFPNMGDGGLGAGAALELYHRRNNASNNSTTTKTYQLENVYLGQDYSDEVIERQLKRYKLTYQHHKNIEKEIAALISKKKVVARCDGAMEFGPRALGNRTIMYEAKDPEVNKWLNERLKRTEFMPFAPATLFEDREKCYKNVAGAEHSAEFMTITFDCTDFMRKNSPAAVHVDNTARPQLVRKEVNPSFYKVIQEYKKITGIPTVINTSFNMHEEPIVCTPSDAIRSFLQGNLDYLAIGNFLVRNKKNKPAK